MRNEARPACQINTSEELAINVRHTAGESRKSILVLLAGQIHTCTYDLVVVPITESALIEWAKVIDTNTYNVPKSMCTRCHRKAIKQYKYDIIFFECCKFSRYACSCACQALVELLAWQMQTIQYPCLLTNLPSMQSSVTDTILAHAIQTLHNTTEIMQVKCKQSRGAWSYTFFLLNVLVDAAVST